MGPEWNRSDLKAATAGQLLFTATQGAKIREEVRRRTLGIATNREFDKSDHC
jgi:hypothetical protein